MAGIRRILQALLYGWLLALLVLLRALLSLLRRREGTNDDEHERKRARTRCVPIDEPAFKRPDPLVYDQYYLIDRGINVTWDNPDFGIFQGGVPVPSHTLSPDTAYDVVVRVWNASIDCPAALMPVHLSYMSFGVGTTTHPIGTDKIDVGVIGSANNPAFARFKWRTPPAAGHYCLQARLDPVADREWGNNLGQHNTDVVAAHSPAHFDFLLRNAVTVRRQFGFTVDAYELGPVEPCRHRPGDDRERQARHTRPHPLPTGWSVDIVPSTPTLDPDEEVPIKVTVTPPSSWTGRQTVNVQTHYLDASGKPRPAGGVTVTVEAS